MTLNKELFTVFSVDLHNKKRKLRQRLLSRQRFCQRNDRIFYFLTFKGECHDILVSPEYVAVRVYWPIV